MILSYLGEYDRSEEIIIVSRDGKTNMVGMIKDVSEKTIKLLRV